MKRLFSRFQANFRGDSRGSCQLHAGLMPADLAAFAGWLLDSEATRKPLLGPNPGLFPPQSLLFFFVRSALGVDWRMLAVGRVSRPHRRGRLAKLGGFYPIRLLFHPDDASMPWFSKHAAPRRRSSVFSCRRRRVLRSEALERRLLLAAEIEPNGTAASATTLPRGDAMEGSISSTQDVDFFRVALNRGDRFSINTANINAPLFSPTLPPGLEILDSSGRTLVTSNDGDAAQVVAPATGDYYVRIASQNAFGTFVGPYGMQSSYTAAPNNTESEPNDVAIDADDLNGVIAEPVMGRLSDSVEQDFFTLNVRSGQTLVVAFAGLQQSGPAVEVLDSFGNVLGENQSGSGIVLSINADDAISIVLSGQNSSGAIAGDYAMVVDLVDDAQSFAESNDSFESAAPLDTSAYRGNFVGTIEGQSDRDLFEFQIDDIEYLRFDLQLSGREQIVESGKEMRLYNALGQQVIYSPNGRISTEVDDALVPGTYYLEVLADSPIGTGAYAVEYVTITDFSLQRDNAVHFMDFDSTDPYLGFDRVASYAVPEAIEYYIGTFESRFGVYDVQATRDKPADGKERIASGIGDFGDIGAGGYGGGGRGIRSSNGNTVNSARETAATALRRLTTTTVNHEFGHAAGLPHARDVQALMSYVGTAEYLPVGSTYAFQGTDSRRPGNQVYDARDYLDFTLQPGAQVYVSEQTESAGAVGLDNYLKEMSIDYTPTAGMDVGDRPFDVVTGDFNNDGRGDIAVASDETDTVEVFITAADGSLGTPLVIAAGGNLGWWTDPLDVGDFDGDGDDDLALTINGLQGLSLLMSNGDGTFAAPLNYSLGARPNGVHVVDLDGDNNLDVVATTSGSNLIHVYRGNGSGLMTPHLQLPVGSNPHGVTSGDFNGDGVPDLASADFSSDNLSVWLGDGNAGFGQRMVVDTGDGPQGVTSSDFNGDGRDDLAAVYRGDRAVEIFHADVFGDLRSVETHDTRIQTYFLESADIDQDGLQDLIIGGFGNTLKVQLGNADGTFTRPISIQTGNGESMGAVVDLDGDGDNEIVIANYWSGTLSIVDEPVDDTANDRVVVFGDIDTDRDVDQYTIDVAAGQRIRFDIDSAEFQYPLDSIMSVYASDGTLIAQSDDATDGNTGIVSVDPFLDWVFANADTVTIVVEGKYSSAGHYRLKLTPERAIDSVGPTVLAMYPDNGASTDSTQHLTFYFDSVIDQATLTDDNIVVTDSGGQVVLGTAFVNPLDSTVVWTAEAPLAAGDYSVRLVSGAGGITDLAGNPLNGQVAADYAFPDRSGSATSPQEDFQATLTITGSDTTAAIATNVTYVRDPYNASQFIVRMSDRLSLVSVHEATFTLRGTGPDGLFDTADDSLAELDATYEAINTTFNPTLYLYARGVVDSGQYRIDADLIDAAGNQVVFSEPVSVSGSVSELNLFTDVTLTTPGLTGSYVNASLRTVDELDWRASQTISGTRIDPKVSFTRSEFGARSSVGVTGGASDDNWDNFSVQWDGYVVIPEDGVQLLTRSDDSSRFWVDLNRDGVFAAEELFDNGWGGNQALRSGEVTPGLSAGAYPVRIQYQEAGGGNEMHFEWIRPGRRVDVAGFIHGPSVTEVSLTPGTHFISDSIDSLQVTFSGNLDPSTLIPGNFTLLRSDDPSFFDGNDVQIFDADGVIAWDPTTKTATMQFAEALLTGFYLLDLNGDPGGIANTAGDLLDGEFLSNTIAGNDNLFLWDKKPSGNGIAGGDYRAMYSVARPELEIEIDPGQLSENGGQAIATITRRNTDLSNSIVVALAVSDSSELSVGSSFVTIPAGSSSVTVPVSAVDDDLLDGMQLVTVTATATDFVSDSAVVRVEDYETFELEFSAAAVFENNDSITLTLTRLDTRFPATVNLAITRPDKVRWSTTTVSMAVGQAQASVTLSGRDNQLVDGTQVVSITTTSAGMIDANILLDVLDYEPLVLEIDRDSIAENGDTTTARLIRTDVNQPLTATLTTTPAGLLNVPATVTFADGEATSDPFIISGVDNDVIDVVRVGTVIASGPGYISAMDTVNVTDFEELELITASNTIPENGGAIQMQIRRTDPTGHAVATLTSTSPGRLAVPGSVQFFNGNHLSEVFFAQAIDNDRLEGEQLVTVVASSGGYQLSQTEIVIADHEALTLTRIGDPLTEESGTATYVVTRPGTGTTALVEISGGAFESLRLPENVLFGPGDRSVTFTAEVVDNPIVAGDQQVSVFVQSPGYVGASLTETIQDNDTPELRFTIDSTELTEGDRPSVARLTRNTLQGLTVSIVPSVSGMLSLPSTLTFLPGRPTVEFELSTIDNSVVDGSRGLELTFSGAGHPDLVTAFSIVDDEIASFGFLEQGLQLTEGESPGTASIVLGTRPITDVTIAIQTSDETQLTVSKAELTFTPNNWGIPQTIEVIPVDDQTAEAGQQLSLIATVTSGIAFDELGSQTLLVDVVDDDLPEIVLEQTDGSTIVNEFGLDDEFSLRLASRPQSPVQVSVDGAEVPEAVFAPSVLTFTPDNWDQLQTVVVSTPLDFDVDRHMIGSVFVKVDQDVSDSVYGSASRRIIGVVHVDSITSDLRIRQEGDRVILIDQVSGAILRSTPVDEPGSSTLQTGARSEAIFVEPMPDVTAVTIETAGGNDRVSLSQLSGGLVDGGSGEDTIALVAAGTLPAEISGGVALRNIEQIDLTDPGEQSLALDAAGVIAMTDQDNVLLVKPGPEDHVSLIGDRWEFTLPVMVAGYATHRLISDDATIQLTSGSIWQNPFNRFDVDKNGSVSALDALVTVNRLAVQSQSQLPSLPVSSEYKFYDVNGDGLATTRDALAVINWLARQRAGEGESPIVVPGAMPGESDQVTSGPDAAVEQWVAQAIPLPADSEAASNWDADAVDAAIDSVIGVDLIRDHASDDPEEEDLEWIDAELFAAS